MFERFTEGARAVVTSADEHARRMGHAEITTGHVLLGIIDRSEGSGAHALRALGVKRGVAAAVVAAEGAKSDTDVEPKFGADARRAFELALREALSLGHNYIGTEHLLLGVVRIPEGAHMRVLNARGLDVEAIRNQIIRSLSGSAKVSRSSADAERAAMWERRARDLAKQVVEFSRRIEWLHSQTSGSPDDDPRWTEMCEWCGLTGFPEDGTSSPHEEHDGETTSVFVCATCLEVYDAFPDCEHEARQRALRERIQQVWNSG